MNDLDATLELCPTSDVLQSESLRKQYGLEKLANLRDAVIFGTGRLGTSIAHSLNTHGIGVFAFSDNDVRRWGDIIEGIPVIPPSALDSHRPVVIASKFIKEIDAGLRVRHDLRLVPHYLLPVLFPGEFPGGFHTLSANTVKAAREDIREIFFLMSDEASRRLFLTLLRFRITLAPADLPDPTPGQYFPGDFWPLSRREVFVDVGACGGDTLTDFLCYTQGTFVKYFAVEPDPSNLAELGKMIPAGYDGQIVVLSCGAGERRQRVAFVADAGGESRVATDGYSIVDIVPLDELLVSEAVSTIKIDTEGYEREVLRGAQRTIAEKRPKLAVSVYHFLRDLWEIPLWIHRSHAGYRFYLRHHTPEIYDSVLYCVPEMRPEARSGEQENLRVQDRQLHASTNVSYPSRFSLS